jgi:hypothetical protein
MKKMGENLSDKEINEMLMVIHIITRILPHKADTLQSFSKSHVVSKKAAMKNNTVKIARNCLVRQT